MLQVAGNEHGTGCDCQAEDACVCEAEDQFQHHSTVHQVIAATIYNKLVLQYISYTSRKY